MTKFHDRRPGEGLRDGVPIHFPEFPDCVCHRESAPGDHTRECAIVRQEAALVASEWGPASDSAVREALAFRITEYSGMTVPLEKVSEDVARLLVREFMHSWYLGAVEAGAGW